MLLASSNRYARVLAGAALAVTLSLCLFPDRAARAEAGPFGVLAGSWSGNGTLTQTSGAHERIRCKASYDVLSDGKNLQLRLRCASDSYNFDLYGSAQYDNGSISGTWSEGTRNVSGRISGHADATQITVVAEGSQFSAGLMVSTHGTSQSVTIHPNGTSVASVSISMRRG